jgi:OFA family oxalate/formate antiporter-like MFS transporter
VTVNYGIMYTAKGAASLLVPLGNLLSQATGSWHAVYAVGCLMNVTAALLGFFVLRPVINSRLKKVGSEPEFGATTSPAFGAGRR